MFEEALNFEIGASIFYVPSIVEALHGNVEQRLEQLQARRDDIAIANGTGYEKARWHIGILTSDKCTAQQLS
jgi:hypothetical protein